MYDNYNLGYHFYQFSLGYALKNEERQEPAPKIDFIASGSKP